MSTFIQVFGRIRPPAAGGDNQSIEFMDKNRIKCEGFGGKESKVHELHRFFPPTTSQTEVFTVVAKKLVEDCTKGINVTIFAYGQTGSGKTHTMLGPSNDWSNPDTKGLIPRSIEHLFDELERKSEECQKFTYTVVAQFVELYNEVIYDLLGSSNRKVTLRDTGSEVHLVDAQCEEVRNWLDSMHVVKRGWDARRTGETAMNRDSSRSHAILILKIKTEEVIGSMLTTRESTLNLVDLAGSERQAHSKATGERLKEATHINGSLSVLGRCIRVLSKPTDTCSHVAYRESHLTHILKNSLGGNSKTAVIVNMHPDRRFLAETSSTLMFASTCSMIKNKVVKNETMSSATEEAYKMAIRELNQEHASTIAQIEADYERKLEAVEKDRKECHETLTQVKADSDEMRAKYNVLLIKHGIPEEEAAISRCSGKENWNSEEILLDEAQKQIATLRLELNVKIHEIEGLNSELTEMRSRQLNDSVAFLRTPSAKNRRSSRNLRRETLYKPSPSRLLEMQSRLEEEENESENWELKYQQCELEKEELRVAGENQNRMWEEKFLERVKSSSELQKKLENKLYSAENAVKELQMENDELSGKINRNKADLSRLLTSLQERDENVRILEHSQKELVDRYTKQINDLEEYHRAEISKLKESHEMSLNEQMNDEFKKLNLDIQQRDDEIAMLVARNSASLQKLQDENAKKEAEISLLRDAAEDSTNLKVELEEKINEIRQLENECAQLKQKALANGILQSEVKRRDEEISELAQICKETKKTVSAKEETIAGLEKAVAEAHTQLRKIKAEYTELQQEVLAGRSLQLRYEGSLENERSLNAQIEDLKNQLSERFREHNIDVKNVKIKCQLETEDVRNTLEMERRLHKETKAQNENELKERNKKFDEKMENFRKTFQQKKVEEIKELEYGLKLEHKNELKAINKVHSEKVTELTKKVEALEKLRAEDSSVIENALGHANKEQKLNYINKCRTRIAQLEQENNLLKAQVDTKNATTRVLRSRANNQ